MPPRDAHSKWLHTKEESTLEEEFVSVFSPRVARNLIKSGVQVVDIKPFKEDSNRTIFIFKKTDEVMKEIHKKKE